MDIHKPAFPLPHFRIIGTHNCGKPRRDSFKFCAKFQYVSCRRDYAERVLARFSNQIQSKYYGKNISVSIGGGSLEDFSTIDTDTETLSHPGPTRHAMFHSIFSDHRKQDSATTATYIKNIIQLLRERNFLNTQYSTIWENTYGYAEHYRCATSLHLF